MRLFLVILLTTLSITSISSLAYIVYENNEELRAYKRELFGVRKDYTNLQNDYESFQEKVKNLRQISVLAKDEDGKSSSVSAIMSKYTDDISGDISIYFKNLGNDESVIIDGEKEYHMASLYKVIVTLFILEQVKEGNLDLEKDNIGSPPISIEEALNKIITESNNEYALALAHEYGWETIETAMKEKLGIEFNFSENLDTTIEDIGRLFEEIALSLKISNDESGYLLTLLSDQKRTAKLPKYLPLHIYSHNKTGELEGYSHDAGIFYTPKANYILIFMSNTKTPGNTDEQMAKMSREIYDLLNQ